MDNSVNSKTMENLRKRINVSLIISVKDMKKICKQTKSCFTKNV